MNKLVGATCLGLFLALTASSAMAQSLLMNQTHCRAAVREYLIRGGVVPTDISSVDIRADSRSLTAVDSFSRKRRVTYQAWARLRTCESSLRFRLDEFCRVSSSDIPKDCMTKGLESSEEPEEGLMDMIQKEDKN